MTLPRLPALAIGTASIVLGACGGGGKHSDAPTVATASVAGARDTLVAGEASANAPAPEETDAEYSSKVEAAVESLGADAVEECKTYVREACKRQSRASRASLCMTYADSIRPTAASTQGSIVCKAAADGFTR
jgi:hypothetical protein